MGKMIQVLLVFGIDAGATASQVLETAGLEADEVEALVFVQSASRASEVLQRRGSAGHHGVDSG
jgi:hypothetical protein